MIRRVLLAVALLVLLTATPAGAAAGAEPSLTIAIDDGVAEVRPGDAVVYAMTVVNAGGSDFDGTVTIDAPGFLELEPADASTDGGVLSWDVQLAAGERFEVTVEGVVGENIEGQYQVVVLAAVADPGGKVLVRAADADRIADTQAPPVVPGLEEPVGPSPWPMVIAIAGVLVVIAALLLLVVRLRKRD